MNALHHEMILASAGSGKTYALTNRFVALLARGAQPERIVALTFTRKAAGEFFDEILTKLATAAREPGYAQKLAAEIGHLDLGPADFLRMLRALVSGMHRLRLGTLDGFFARIVRSFPMELGLAGEFELLEEHAARLERQRVLRRIFADALELSAAQREFVEAFKRATFGTEEKRLGPRLEAFLDDYQDVYLTAPGAEQWGESARIWPDGCAWRFVEGSTPDGIAALRTALSGAALNDGQRARWEVFLNALADWAPGVPLPSASVDYILKNALDVWLGICAGRAEMVVERRKFIVEGEVAAALRRVITQMVGSELQRHLATTQGIHSVLRSYEMVYHERVRRAGKLTFSDVQRLLVPGGQVPLLAQDSGGAEAEESRLTIDYRLDGGIDHWLFDEFQDTSYGQWLVLRNLVDEALQDASGARSFFCVGDVKQAIYTWRQGDHRLFREIFNHYNGAMAGKIIERHLVDSFRSGPALIEMVNAVFGNQTVLKTMFPGEASEMWAREWRRHVSAVPQRTGQAALLHAPNEMERWILVSELLKELRPLERGLSCAVLVQTNEIARDLAEFLRKDGAMPAVAESDLHVCIDNPLGAAVLALLQAAAHPGDTLAWEQVQMTPLRVVLLAEGIGAPETLSERVLGQIHTNGFEWVVEFWLRKLEAGLGGDDAFSRERSGQMVRAAAEFDETGSNDVSEFGEFMERYVVRDVETPTAVRVMTVHKSKGLGFDVVLLPDLEGKKLAQARDGLAVHKNADRSVDWVLELPPKLFWRQDEVLARHMEVAEAETCYEKLALLYVAMTRAKRAMYVITQAVGSSKSQNYPRLLGNALGFETKKIQVGRIAPEGTWSSGDPEWHEEVKTAPARSEDPLIARIPPLEPRLIQIPRTGHPIRRPTSETKGFVRGGHLFGVDGSAGVDFGSAVHALLATVEWDDGMAAFTLARGKGSSMNDAALAEALACLTAPELAIVWNRPINAMSEVWRERAFEVVLDGTWISGVFDRVIVVHDTSGKVVRASVFDFKTDHVEDETDIWNARVRHSVQIATYCRVVSVLTGLALDAIEGKMVLTGPCRVVSMRSASG
ncbi:MAG: UvrD-helicase domain-containing protein [Opitutaceae bacterium]